MKKFTFLFALVLIVSTLNAQNMRKRTPLNSEAEGLMKIERAERLHKNIFILFPLFCTAFLLFLVLLFGTFRGRFQRFVATFCTTPVPT
jgi:hypothetical protein